MHTGNGKMQLVYNKLYLYLVPLFAQKMSNKLPTGIEHGSEKLTAKCALDNKIASLFHFFAFFLVQHLPLWNSSQSLNLVMIMQSARWLNEGLLWVEIKSIWKYDCQLLRNGTWYLLQEITNQKDEQVFCTSKFHLKCDGQLGFSCKVAASH